MELTFPCLPRLVLASRRNHSRLEHLVLWSDGNRQIIQWERRSDLEADFPDFVARDRAHNVRSLPRLAQRFGHWFNDGRFPKIIRRCWPLASAMYPDPFLDVRSLTIDIRLYLRLCSRNSNRTQYLYGDLDALNYFLTQYMAAQVIAIGDRNQLGNYRRVEMVVFDFAPFIGHHEIRTFTTPRTFTAWNIIVWIEDPLTRVVFYCDDILMIRVGPTGRHM